MSHAMSVVQHGFKTLVMEAVSAYLNSYLPTYAKIGR